MTGVASRTRPRPLAGRLGRVADLARYAVARSESCEYVGWTGHHNLGDEAMRVAVARYLRRPLVSRGPGDRHALSRLVGRRRLAGTVLGGGTLVGAGYADAFAASLRRTGTGVAFGTGVQDPGFWATRGGLAEPLERWRELLSRCAVGVRGPRSAELLGDLGLDVTVLGDPVARFVMGTDWWQPEDGILGLNVGRTSGPMWGDEEEVVRELTAFARRRVERGWTVDLFVVWRGDDDVATRTAAALALPATRIHRIYHDPEEFLTRVRRVRAFVGLKLHATALALCAGVPSLALEYRPKVSDFTATVDGGRWTLSTGSVGGEVLDETFADLVTAGPEVSRSATAALTELRDRQEQWAQTLEFRSSR